MPFRPPSAKAVTPGGKGRFPGFDVLDEVDHWDDVTAGVVLARLDPQPEVSFFTVAEQATAARTVRPTAGPGQRAEGTRAAPRRPPLGARPDRRVALRRHARRRRRLASNVGRARRRRSGTPWRPIPPIDLGTARGTGPSSPRRRNLARPAGIAGVEPMDPLHQHGVLLPPLGVERDRFRRTCLPPRVQSARRRKAGGVGGSRSAQRRSGDLCRARAAGQTKPC